ncbi:MAG: class I poly(R)-hydroxyalkanoic acid synthase [Betaproteobacteria bacterium]|nr:class I poly(R)-hydroxyalkanoic acid synthase [Betaproteobacteria bacterium]
MGQDSRVSGGSRPAGPDAGAGPAGGAGRGDPAEMARVLSEVAQRTGKLLDDYIRKHASGGRAGAVADELGVAKAFMDLWAGMLANPWSVAESQARMFWDYSTLWSNTCLRMMGQAVEPVATPVKGDNRFRDEEWENYFLFDYLKQSYLIAGRSIRDAVAGVKHLPEQTRRKLGFYTRQYIDAVSPSNFVLTNPLVLRETLQSGGQNLVKGLNNLLADLEHGEGELRISMTDENAFKLGVNVATTPGKVVFQNDLAQLIQYEPLTKVVHRRPLLIMPPWINKYYILDLREKNSFIRWALEQGHTVFVVSWVNPDKQHAQKTFEDYMLEGPLALLDAIEAATGEKEVNLIGYCLGGTLLGGTLGYMAAKKDRRIASATFFVALLDFSVPGELGVFIDEAQVANLEKRMHQRGFLEGSEMASTFNLLRANDLIWSFVINNYLLGKEPFPFDLLYWNSDSTRMPARMHSFYLRNMYLKNALKDPGGITLCGVPIDLSKVDVPAYFISTVEDHIAPWKSTYRGAKVLGGGKKTRFVLGGSGHIAGVVNPPSANKYGYWTNADLPPTAEEWQDNAEWHQGSWWSDWQAWIGGLNGPERVPARRPGDGGLRVIEDAPGSYVSVRLGKSRKKHIHEK